MKAVVKSWIAKVEIGLKFDKESEADEFKRHLLNIS